MRPSRRREGMPRQSCLGNPCVGVMGMWDEKCGRAEDEEECLGMVASALSPKKICKYMTKDGGDDKEGDEKPQWMPPKDCKCASTEIEGKQWPAKCATNPGGKTYVCYVERSAEFPCEDSKLSSKSKLKYVMCE